MKRAFTLIELILVIVIIGIVTIASAMFLPNHTLLNDSNFISMEIKRVQSKAIGNNQYVFNSNTWRANPDTSSCITLTKASLNISKAQGGGYAIHRDTTISVTPNSINRVCFDHLGKPYANDFQIANVLVNSVNITVQYRDETRVIKILPYSGYVLVIW